MKYEYENGMEEVGREGKEGKGELDLNYEITVNCSLTWHKML